MAMRLLVESATYALLSLANATPTGSSKRVEKSSEWTSCTVPTTAWKVGLSGSESMTLTESDTWFATQTSPPSGRTAMLTGSMPTLMRRSNRRFATSITSTVSAGVFAT